MAAQIPGSNGFPLIGSAYTYFFRSGEELLKDSIDRIDVYGSPCKLWLGPVLNILIDDPNHVKVMLNSTKCLKKPYFYEFLGVNLGLMSAKRK